MLLSGALQLSLNIHSHYRYKESWKGVFFSLYPLSFRPETFFFWCFFHFVIVIVVVVVDHTHFSLSQFLYVFRHFYCIVHIHDSVHKTCWFEFMSKNFYDRLESRVINRNGSINKIIVKINRVGSAFYEPYSDFVVVWCCYCDCFCDCGWCEQHFSISIDKGDTTKKWNEM